MRTRTPAGAREAPQDTCNASRQLFQPYNIVPSYGKAQRPGTASCCTLYLKVLAVDTFAHVRAVDGGLEALAVLLEAGALLAVAALGVARS